MSNPFLIDDPAKAHGVTNQGWILRHSIEPVVDTGLPPIISAANLMGQQLREPRELIQGVLHQGLKGVLAGPSKVGKTWLLLDLALSVASGIPWIHWPTTKSKVLFVNLELPPYFISNRVQSLNHHKPGFDLGNLDLWNLRGFSCAFEEMIPRITKQILEEGYALIIIDPIYKGLDGADENKAGDASILCNVFEKLAVDTGAAVLYAHHFSKGKQGKKDVLDRMSGSGVFARDPDTIFAITEHEEENCYTMEMVLRNLPSIGSIVIERTFPVVTVRDDLNPYDLEGKPGPKACSNDDLLKLLDVPLRTGEWQDTSMSHLGISKATFMRGLQKLKQKDLIEEVAEEVTNMKGKQIAVKKWRLKTTDKSQSQITNKE